MKISIYRQLRLFGLSILGTMAGAYTTSASAAVSFPTTSEYARGRWVKVDFKNTGIFEISYAQLREMGFSDPTKVGVYGHGAEIQPMQFTDSKGNPVYSPKLKPVAMMHADDKIIFFGQGPALIRQMTNNISNPARQQFELVSNNTYAKYGSYLLTDSRTDMLVPEKVVRGLYTRNPYYTTAWQIQYHENDLITIIGSGREFFGEDLVAGTTVDYNLPNYQPGNDLSMTFRAAHSAGKNVSEVNMTFASEGEKTTYAVEMQNNGSGDYYNIPINLCFTPVLPGASGTIDMKYNGESSWSRLDYFILASRSPIDMGGDKPSVMAFTGDFNSSKYYCIKVRNNPSDLVVWDIVNPNSATLCPWEQSGNDANVRYLSDNKTEGMMVAFSPSASHPGIESWSEIKPTGLLSLGMDEIPDLLIITLPELRPAAERIAALHRAHEGFTTAIVNSEDVINEFTAGVPDPMAYRALCKMIYDRDNPSDRKFKNVLLLGPCLRDYRNIEGRPVGNTLICNESFQSRNVDNSFTLNDWYGMMEDFTASTPDAAANSFAKVPLHLGVGNIPCRDLGDALNYVAKLEAFYADDSFAYWLNEANYAADGADNNEHQVLMEALYTDGQNAAANVLVGHKLYNNLYEYKGTTYAFARNLNTGALTNFYLGHADVNGLNAEFWKPADEILLKNKRLGFMTFGACSVTAFDNNDRGTGESLVFRKDNGLIGSVMSTRSCYSYSNYLLSTYFQLANLQDNLSDDAPLLSKPRTVGEAYAMAKTAYDINGNELAYVLLSDPALTLPLPTASVSAKIDGIDGNNTLTVYPHQKVKVEGTVTDRKGNRLKDFSGTVVAKVFNPRRAVETTPRYEADVKTIMLDDEPVIIVAFQAEKGVFSGEITFPSTMSQSDDYMGTIRLAAYDPTTRRGAAGSISIKIAEYDADKAVATDNAPSIDRMYVNCEDFQEGMIVGPDFTLYADITDDHGVMISEINYFPALSLIVDGRTSSADVKDYVRLSDSGRRCRVAYPCSGMQPGTHTLTIEAKDAEGQMTTRSITVRVGPPGMTAALTTDDAPATDSALFTLSPAENEVLSQATIIILNAAGQEVLSAPMKNNSFEWNLLDASGNRVPAGPYTAVCRLTGAGMRHGVSAACRKVVF